MARRVAIFSEASAANQSKLRGFTVDIISNMVAVHAFARRMFEAKNVEDAAEEQRHFAMKSWIAAEMLLLVNSILLAFFASVVVLTAFHFWRMDVITLGEFVTALTLVGNVAWFVLFIGSALNGFATNIGEVRNGLNEIILPHEVTDALEAKALPAGKGSIEFRDMSFAYDARPVFTHFSLSVAPGERVGIVGPSGSGKTTLMSLLLRQHDVTDGAITIDGMDVREVTLDSLRQAIASVPQDPYLFHRTIRENIRYGRLEASDDEVAEAAKKAQAHEFIMALPDGYDTMVGERGVKLSGGQRQRIAIARGILKGAPILVLDEATSSLDSESESAIQEALTELMKGKTVLAIAHRLSTIRAMDRILVIEQGAVVEDGTHETLLRKGGVYARLWKHQAGGFLAEEETED
jgi:ATP-binding cassette subfamily B protein